MAKKTCTLSLDEETIRALDEASEKLGMSRSMVANQVLGATIGDASITDVVNTMFAAAKSGNQGTRKSDAEWYPAFD